MLKVIIIDDEPDAVQAISLIVQEYCSFAEVIGTASSVIEGRELIKTALPDVVILDIEMPRGTGFDLLESIPERSFEVIFVTAYNQYAIKAFKYSAIDYILKPIDIDEFIKALEKAHQNSLKLYRVNSNYDCLLENIRTPFPSKIALATLDNMEYISVTDIVRIEASGSYSKVFTKDNHSILVSKSMKDFQDFLEPGIFFRSHNSHIINLNQVRKFWFRDGGYLEMSDKSNVPISRRKKEEFLILMNKITGKG